MLTIRDALIVSDLTGRHVVADIGNCWMERDVEDALVEAGDRTCLVQLADVKIGTLAEPGPEGKGVPGDGELDVKRFVAATLEAGYRGLFELEMVGAIVECEGYRPVIIRAIDRMNTMLGRLL